jgi:hypothetical protein
MQAKQLVAKSINGRDATEVGILATYDDGAVLIGYVSNWKNLKDQVSSNRRVCFCDSEGRMKWDMIAE